MSIEEEIKILENALSGALLVPSECTFVSTEIIKICLDTLKTYESWENLIKYEIEQQIRADAINEVNESINDNGAFQMNPQITEYDKGSNDAFEIVLDILEQLKEQK